MKLHQLLRAREGATAIEYAMIAAFVAIGIISVIQAAGQSVQGMFADLLSGFTG